MRFLRILVVTAIFWFIFVAGYLTRGVLGGWLISAHSGSVSEQLTLVSVGVTRLFLTFAILVSVGAVCVLILFGIWAAIQEAWYQLFTRRVVSLLTRRRERREKELQQAEEDDADIGAPKESVNIRKHARNARGGVNNLPKDDKPGPPKQSLLSRIQELQLQAENSVAAESVFEDEEIEVVYES